ncbi:MAG TPA: class I SAM-dependent methyltransferase [Allosphingosinicella sp.]|jgi:SAM-dependent methyltransferase
MYDLFEKFAHRYDLHTPPDHYKHDHAFVLERASAVARGGRLFDVGCGTGAFLEKALAAGFDASGADSAPGMVEVAAARLGPGRVRIERMQELAEQHVYDVVCALSWTIHYAADAAELRDIVGRCATALRPGGLLLLQAANAALMTGAVRVDREPGPKGEPDDTLFIHRFRPLGDVEQGVEADYVYASQALGELLTERHHLRFCDPEVVAETMRRAGLFQVEVVDPKSLSPFVAGRC